MPCHSSCGTVRWRRSPLRYTQPYLGVNAERNLLARTVITDCVDAVALARLERHLGPDAPISILPLHHDPVCTRIGEKERNRTNSTAA